MIGFILKLAVITGIIEIINEYFSWIQLYTGLSPPALALLLYMTFITARKASESGSVVNTLGAIGFSVLFWWLIGYLLINPAWNFILGRIPTFDVNWWKDLLGDWIGDWL